jgi:uncharacterized membrane protein YcaP (DUF421 family)
MQYLVISFLSVRSPLLAEAVRSEPTLLARDGRFLDGAMRRQRVTEDEALSAVRAAGGTDITNVNLLVLESDGTISASLRRTGEK